ncbi:MAG: sulfopyruvate decarboxylase [Chloroflexi bacterium]|nr:sulfopyruvate decarboxylase [Chloroflexota bacterium]
MAESDSEWIRDKPNRLILEGLKENGVHLVASLPDTWLGGAEDLVAQDPELRFVPVTNEGEGLAICAGAWLAGRRSALIIENSGLLVAAHQLETVCAKYEVPVLILASYRGHVGDGVWWLEPLGERLLNFLDAMDVRYAVVSRVEDIKGAIRSALVTAEMSKQPMAVLFTREAVLA